MAHHTIKKENFKDYQSDLILANTSGKSLCLRVTIDEDGDLETDLIVSNWEVGDKDKTRTSQGADTFLEAIELYNDLP